jgi:centrosomal protein CEP135
MAKLYNESYIELKRKLDSLNYSYPFDISSCRLIELLVNDILKLKGEVTKVITEKETVKQKLDQMDLNYRAIEFENRRLLKENNDLHKEMIDLSKKLSLSGSAKDMEIKRLSEEKNDLKFLNNEIKCKIQKIEKENVKLKTRMSGVLVKIFDSNFSENNLRKLFNEHVFLEVKEGHLNTENDNLFDLNFDLIMQDGKKKDNSEAIIMGKTNNDPQMLEITLPKRSISITQVLEPNQQFEQNNNNFDNNEPRINHNSTNSNHPYSHSNSNNQLEQAMKNTFLKTADDLIVKASSTAFNSDNDCYKNLTKKNEYLLKQVDKLTNQLNERNRETIKMTREVESSTKNLKSDASNQNELVLKYLKDENSKLVAKYEERINYMIKENRKLQAALDELMSQTKKKVVAKKVVGNESAKLEKKAKLLEDENKVLKNEVSYLQEKIERNEKTFDLTKYVPKEYISIYEEKSTKLKEDYDKAQELILKLNEKIQNLISSSNSEKVFLKNNIKNLNMQDEVRNSERKQLSEKIKEIENEKEDLSEKINNLNSLLSQRENTIHKLNEFINTFKGDWEELKKEKMSAVGKINELEKEIILLRRNIALKEGEIEKLSSINNIFEKENEILKLRIGK